MIILRAYARTVLSWIVAGLALSTVAWGQTPAGEEIHISEGTGSGRVPAVASLANGDFIVVWQSEAPGGIRGRRIAADGSLRGDELRIDTLAGGEGRAPAVASAAAAGGFVVVWESAGSPGDDSSMTSVQARRFRFDGEPDGRQFQVNTYTTNRQQTPAVAMDAAGGFVVVWESYGSVGNDRSRASVQGQRFGSDGARRGEQFQVNAATAGPQGRPSVAMDADGDFVVIWERSAVRGRRFAASGEALGEELRLGDDLSFSSAVAMDAGGDFVVVWQRTGSYAFGAQYHSILARSFSAGGEPLDFGRPVELHDDFTVGRGADLAPDVAAPAAGEMVVVWGDGYYEGVSGGRFTHPGLTLGTFEAGSSPGAYDPAVAADPNGRLLVVWSQAVGSDFEIRGRRLAYEVAARACRDRPTALCLQDDRFTVEIAWRDFRGATGSARVVPVRSADSGLFWFFDADNWEVLVKVLDGCAINGHYWVFAAATTTVEYTLRVTDEARGVSREYANVLGEAARAVTDTGAFATCP